MEDNFLEYTFLWLRTEEGGLAPINVKIFQPRRLEANHYACSYNVSGLKSLGAGEIYGFDSFQSFALCLNFVMECIQYGPEARKGRIVNDMGEQILEFPRMVLPQLNSA